MRRYISTGHSQPARGAQGAAFHRRGKAGAARSEARRFATVEWDEPGNPGGDQGALQGAWDEDAQGRDAAAGDGDRDSADAVDQCGAGTARQGRDASVWTTAGNYRLIGGVEIAALPSDALH